MRHLMICPELPPARGGGIGTYAATMARLLAERGEIVHAIGLTTLLSGQRVELQCNGRLVIHRIPWTPQFREARELLGYPFRPKPFTWHAALLAERIIEEERIDVVEAQEYQAPLYWLQARRALGLGPARKPPCIVHLHSPTLLLARHNNQRPSGHVRETVRMERFTIRAADEVIAPSRELARWAETHYRLGTDSVGVIPYPMDASPTLERTAATWASGTICYVGRLEVRKGVVEWVDAAVRATDEFPQQIFEFVGADTTTLGGRSVRRALLERIPARFRSRFSFVGAQPRAALPELLARARIAVVPSRWDNYPHTCMEAMRSGLPVLGTRTGGIAEMIGAGRNGWLADAATPEHLFTTLRNALRTPPEELAAMGAQAARDIMQLCDASRVAEEHLELRRSISYRGREALKRPLFPIPVGSSAYVRNSGSGSVLA